MPNKRPSLRKDENETAYALVQAMIGEGARPAPPGKREKKPEPVDRGRAGGKKGGTGGGGRVLAPATSPATGSAATPPSAGLSATWKAGSGTPPPRRRSGIP